MKTILEINDVDLNTHGWMLERFVSISYYALIDYNKVNSCPDQLSVSIDWYDVEELPILMMDHREIVLKALQSLLKLKMRTLP